MASHISFMISGLLLVIITIVVQSVPIKKSKETVLSHSINNKQANNVHLNSIDSTTAEPVTTSITTPSMGTATETSSSKSTTTQETDNNKKKRYINDDESDESLNSESDENNPVDSYQVPYFKFKNVNNNIDHKLYAKTQETSAKIHDNAEKPVDTDDSKVFSDIKMVPNELTDIVRRRRDVKLNHELNSRRKRALLSYDLYDTDPLRQNLYYDPYLDWVEQNQYVRPTRAFAPLYWYPTVYQRNVRSALAPSFYRSSEYPALYSDDIDDDVFNAVPLFNYDDDDDDDDDNEYELNRYPILSESLYDPLNNLQLEEQYNADGLPIDEDFDELLNNYDDSDDYEVDEPQYRLFVQRERPPLIRYDPIETYF